MSIFKKATLRFSNISVKTYLFLLSLVLVVVFLFILSYISYYTTTSTIMKRIESIDKSNLSQINNKISFSIGEIERLTRNFSQMDSLANYINDYEDQHDTYSKLEAAFEIKSLLFQLKLPYEEIEGIEIYSGDTVFRSDSANNPTTSTKSIKDSEIYRSIKESGDNIHIFEPFSGDSVFKNGFSGITFGTIIYDRNEEIGLLFVTMKTHWLNIVFKNEKDVVITCRNDSTVLWSSNNEISRNFNEVGNFIPYREGDFIYKEYKGFYMSTKYNDWKVITFKKIMDISEPVNKVKNYIFAAAILSIFLSFAVAGVISSRITRPIFDLIKAIRNYRAQNNFNYNPDSMKGVPLKKTFMRYFIIIVTIPILIYIIIFYFTSSKVIEEKVKDSMLLAFTQTTDNIDSFIAINERISVKILVDESIQDFLLANYEGRMVDKASNKDKVGKIVDDSLALGKNIFDTSIYGVNREILFSTSYYNSDEIMSDFSYENINKSYGDPIWLEYDVDRYNRNVIKLIRKIYAIKDDNYVAKVIGYLSMVYYEENIDELYRELIFPNNNVFMIDNTGKIISHQNKTFIKQTSGYEPDDSMLHSGSRSIIKNGDNIMLVYAECAKLPWILVGEVDYREIRKDTNTILMVNIYTAVSMLLVILILSYLFSRILTGSLGRMKKKLGLLAEGNTDINFIESIHLNEVEELGRAFNDMTHRINDLIETVYRSQLKAKDLENEKKDAELVALQAQINPHFFYNTIDAIKWMIHGGRKEDASEMLTSLADLFRLGISNERRFITVEEEMKYAQAYIDIQKLRLGCKVKFWWSIDSRTFGFMVPKLILQPILENAIKHGIQKKDLMGNISIFCYKDNTSVFFKVIDDGMGIDKVELEKMKNSLNGSLTGTSIGIYNVQKRIKLFFGEEYGLSIESGHGTGTIVKISIPQITE